MEKKKKRHRFCELPWTCPVAYSASKQKPQDDTNDLAIKAARTFKEEEAWRHSDEANTQRNKTEAEK